MQLKRFCVTALAVGSFSLSNSSFASKLELSDLLKSGTVDALQCASFKVKGVCVWLKCTLVFCTTKSNAYVEHYTPDALVTVYSSIGGSPEGISGGITKTMSSLLFNTSGAQQRSSKTGFKTSNYYRVADVYGSPAATALTELLGKVSVASPCETSITSYKPYFVSSTNPLAWNSGLLDLISSGKTSWTGGSIGERDVGDSSTENIWGTIHPRVGVVLNQDHFKASSVIAYRAMDVVFNGAYGMYNQTLGGETKSWYNPSKKINEEDMTEGKWQMLYPKYETGCHILADKSTKSPSGKDLEGWAGRRSNDGSYAWHYWRRYECCKRPSGYSLLYKTTW